MIVPQEYHQSAPEQLVPELEYVDTEAFLMAL